MTVEEMRAECERLIASGASSLVLQQSRGVTLARGRGPRGELLSDLGDRRVVRYDVKKVLEWLNSWSEGSQ